MKTIFITGTSSGIGKATAKLFAQKGWTVIATMRSPEKETELTKYENIHIYPLDVTNQKQVSEICSEVLAKYDVDVLFNNAGYGTLDKNLNLFKITNYVVQFKTCSPFPITNKNGF